MPYGFDPENARFETIALHAGHTPDPTTKSRAVPIYATTSYLFDDTDHAARLFALEEGGNIYTRIMNPTSDVFEQRLAALEGGVGALATASGHAAILLAILTIAEAGDEIVSGSNLYGGTHNLFGVTLARLGIKVVFVDSNDPESYRRAITPRTKALYGECIGNPRLDTLDVAAVAKIGAEHGLPLIVDSTIPTPFLLRPFEHGAAIVIHSTTKYIGGHGVAMGGAVVDSGAFDWGSGRFACMTELDASYHGVRYHQDFGRAAFITKARVQMMRDLGPTQSPFNSFLFLLGLETLPLRMERHSENALRVAKYLSEHPKVAWVNYPGLPSHPTYAVARRYLTRGASGMIGFGVRGGLAAGKKFADSVRLLSLLANIGDAKSLVIHPASTTHSQLSPEARAASGATDDFIRLSVGIENVEDILADVDQALAKV